MLTADDWNSDWDDGNRNGVFFHSEAELHKSVVYWM